MTRVAYGIRLALVTHLLLPGLCRFQFRRSSYWSIGCEQARHTKPCKDGTTKLKTVRSDLLIALYYLAAALFPSIIRVIWYKVS